MPKIKKMATKKRLVAIKKGIKKIKSKKAKAVKKQKKAKTIYKKESKKIEKIPSNFEELLQNRIESKKLTFVNAPVLQDLLYTSTPSLREIAYKSGFSFGKSLYENGKSIDKLAEALEAAGLKDMLYYPFKDKAIIKAKPESNYNLGKAVHIFESGIIAGFMSAASGKIIYVKENKCGFEGNDLCEFYAEPRESLKPEEEYNEEVVEDIAKIAKSESGYKLSQEYLLFSMLPLMKEPIKDEISKLLFAAGSALGKNKEMPSIENLANKLGINAHTNKKGIILEYNTLNSIKGFVDISSALFAGIARGLGGKNIELIESPTKENTYRVYIKLA
jgi:predicted hydrocarbon binding protein